MSNKKNKVKKVSNNSNGKKKKRRDSFLLKFFGGLGYWMKSWVSNDRCIEAREKPGYIPLIITAVSVIIACLPILSSRLSTDVGAVLDTPTYELPTSLSAFQYAATEGGVEINIGNNTLLGINNFDTIENYTVGTGTSAVKCWAHSYEKTIYKEATSSTSSSSDASSSSSAGAYTLNAVTTQTITVYDLLVFNASGHNASAFATNVLTTTNDPNNGWYTGAQTIFATNALIFADDYLYVYKATENLTSATSANILYDAPMFQGKNLIALINEMAGNPTATNYYTDTYKTSLVSAYKSVFVAGYETSKVANAWAYTGIAAVVNVAMILVFGLMVYLMTRGKNNPYRDYKFLECYKIVGWTTFSPAILSLIAFIPAIGGSSIGLLIFVLLLGVRTMWLSMKNLRPTY